MKNKTMNVRGMEIDLNKIKNPILYRILKSNSERFTDFKFRYGDDHTEHTDHTERYDDYDDYKDTYNRDMAPYSEYDENYID